jgi:hypothetical protein
VQLFKPRDLFPCVEDPQKLSYLDLEGCFGDICDLSGCTYLKQKGISLSDNDAKDALQTMLAERWAYDDISDEEASDEEGDDESIAQTDYQPSATGPDDTQSKPSVSQNELTPSFFVSTEENAVIADETGDDEEDSQTPDLIIQAIETVEDTLSSSQESTGVLFKDSQVADVRMVEHYIQLAGKGGVISLRSVEGWEEETLL